MTVRLMSPREKKKVEPLSVHTTIFVQFNYIPLESRKWCEGDFIFKSPPLGLTGFLKRCRSTIKPSQPLLLLPFWSSLKAPCFVERGLCGLTQIFGPGHRVHYTKLGRRSKGVRSDKNEFFSYPQLVNTARSQGVRDSQSTPWYELWIR